LETRRNKKIDRKTRKVLTVCKKRHPKADVDKLYVKKERGKVRPVTNISDIQSRDNSYCRISEQKKYKENWFVNITTSHESNQPNMNSTIKTALKFAEELNQSNKNSDTKKKAFNTQISD